MAVQILSTIKMHSMKIIWIGILNFLIVDIMVLFL